MQVYANYEYGIREPDFDTVIKLAKLYNVTTDYLLGFTSTKKTISIQDALSTIEYSNGKTIHKEDMPALTKVIEKFLR